MKKRYTVRRNNKANIIVSAAAGLTVSLAFAASPGVSDRIVLKPSFIGSAMIAQAPTVTAGEVALTPAAIPSAMVARAPVVVPGAVTIASAFIPSRMVAQAPSVEAVAPGAQTIAPPFLASGMVAQAPSVTTGAVTLAPAAIPSAMVARAPVVTAQAPGESVLSPAFIASAMVAQAPAVTVGEVTVAPTFIASAMVAKAPTVAPGEVSIAPSAIQPAMIAQAPAVTVGAVMIAPTAIPSAMIAKAPVVTVGAVTIAPTVIPSAMIAKAPVVTQTAGGVTYDPNAQAAFDAMTVQPTSARKNLYNDLIVGLKADGIWSKLIGYQLHAGHDDQAVRVDLKDPTRVAAKINSPSFVIDRGFVGDSSAGSTLDTKIPDSVANQDNVSFGGYCNNIGVDATPALCWWGSNATRIITGAGGRCRNTNDANFVSFGSIGLFAMNRSLAASFDAYFNGAFFTTRTGASVAPVNGATLITHRQSSGSTNGNRISFMYASTSLTADEHAKLYNRTMTYLNAIGAA